MIERVSGGRQRANVARRGRPTDPSFDEVYRSPDPTQPAAAWDIGGPQPIVAQMTACGALRGRVLDPGTGPGHHAIHFAMQGHSVVGVDGSAAAIEQARLNAEHAGVRVEFHVGDATRLEGFDACFDTVVDSAFYHVLADDKQAQIRYADTLYRVTTPNARLIMVELGRGTINGVHVEGPAADDFAAVLRPAGWRIDHLSAATYLAHFSVATLDFLDTVPTQRGITEQMKLLARQLKSSHGRKDQVIHLPVWVVVATRIN